MKEINPDIAKHVLLKDWPGLEVRYVKEGRGVLPQKILVDVSLFVIMVGKKCRRIMQKCWRELDNQFF